MFVEIYKKRKKIFDNLNFNLKEITANIKNIDREANIYLFGSVLKGNNNMASDIDILIVTENKERVMKYIWDNNYSDPFEFHIRNEKESRAYFQHINEMKKLG
jgi:predicted nucleotidyltransferase